MNSKKGPVKKQEEPAYEDDEFDAFDSPVKQPVKQPTKTLQNAVKTASGVTVKNAASTGKIANAAAEMKNLVDQKPPSKTEKPAAEPSPRAEAPVILNWPDIVAANDTNKHIIFKFMRKGFTSLSAEELACTMVNADFSLDFKQNTKEDWQASYQFKVVERLNKCNFNLKWKTKSSVTTQGLGDTGQFFDLCKTGDIDRIVKFFRASNQSVQEILDSTDGTQGKCGLHYAVEEGQTQMVEFLINKGAKVDTRDKGLRTPLHLACLGGHSVIGKLLLEYNADPYERDTSGRTSMHYACCTGSVIAAIELMSILVRKNTDLVHMKDHTGRTPLHYAIFNQQADQNKIIEKLLQFGTNINAIDVDKRTPLHFAAESGKGKMCQLLIQNGASVGIQDARKKTPMDLAANDYIREIMIVSNPQTKFIPSEKELEQLLVDGNKAEIRKVVALQNTDYYEPYQHAQPVKPSAIKNKKINQKPKEETEEVGVKFTCACMCQNSKQPTPEMLCMNCRPLGTAAEWETQKASSLPYNIRNYQAKLVENLRRVQQFGVDSYQHVKKPYLFTGSWMEYVRSLDDLMLQINGCRSNEAVLKVFNILFPYDKPLPRGKGDELSLANFYNDQKPRPDDELKDCHPDKLRENVAAEAGNAVTEALAANRVEDINDLLHLQQQMTALQTANHMAMVAIEQKDELIAQLRTDYLQLKTSAGPKILNQDVVALEQQLFQVKLQNEKLTVKNKELSDQILKLETGGGLNDAELKAAERKQYQMVQKLQQDLKQLQQELKVEKERNIQLRIKSGKAFMEALEDPLLGGGGGKSVKAIYVPEDDNALMRLLNKIEQIGGASLEQRLLDAGNISNKMISLVQFDKMLKQIGTQATDFLPLTRIAGYTEMQGNVKNVKVSTIMARINDRPGMRKRIEEETMTHIASYINKRSGMTLEKLFNQFETDQNGNMDIDELTNMLAELKVEVNTQLIRIILAIFDHDQNQMIDIGEFKSVLEKYLIKAPIDAQQIKTNVINETDAKELADMYNEQNRAKAVWEDVDFDYTDLAVIRKREEQALELIKSGYMPEELIQGEITLSIVNSKNLPKNLATPNLYVKLKRVSYNEDGTRAKQNPLVKICNRYDTETGAIDQKIPILTLLGKCKNRQADTMTLEFYFKADTTPNDTDAVFFGECFVPFKQCFELDKCNQWQRYQMFLVDTVGRCKQMVKGQVNIEVRYTIKGHEQSSFNEDGSKKEKKTVAETAFGVKQRDPKFEDRRNEKGGSQGLVYCTPKKLTGFMSSNISGITVDFFFERSQSKTRQSEPAQAVQDYLCWVDSMKLPVTDSRLDTDMTVRLSQDGQLIATGLVPQEYFKSMYDDSLFKLKPFDVVMMKDGQVVAKVFLHLSYEPSKVEESKEVRFNVPQGTKVIIADISEEKTGNFEDQPSVPINIPDIIEDADGDFE